MRYKEQEFLLASVILNLERYTEVKHGPCARMTRKIFCDEIYSFHVFRVTIIISYIIEEEQYLKCSCL